MGWLRGPGQGGHQPGHCAMAGPGSSLRQGCTHSGRRTGQRARKGLGHVLLRAHWSLAGPGQQLAQPRPLLALQRQAAGAHCHKPSGQLLPLDFGQGVVLKGQAWPWSARSPSGPCSSLGEVEGHWVSSGCWRTQLGRWPGSSQGHLVGVLLPTYYTFLDWSPLPSLSFPTWRVGTRTPPGSIPGSSLHITMCGSRLLAGEVS